MALVDRTKLYFRSDASTRAQRRTHLVNIHLGWSSLMTIAETIADGDTQKRRDARRAESMRLKALH